MHRWLTALLVTIATLVPAQARAAWTRFSSEHFVFVSDAADGSVRQTADRLEQFRAVVGRLFGEDVVTSPVPTVVIVFQDDRSFAAFRPLFNGRPVESSGYFVGGEDTNYIAIDAQRGHASAPVIFHEYTHAILRNAFGELPAWVSEGIAQFYQTFETASGGRTAVLGAPDQTLQTLLNSASSSLLPLSQLTAVDRRSSMYNEGDRRGIFYAQSWALVHYLTIGSERRAGQLKQYLAALAAGTGETAAFHQVFGADDAVLERELLQYIRSARMNAVRMPLPERIAGGVVAPVQVIPEDDAAGYLGDLLARIDRADDARALLTKTIDANGEAARARASLGLLELRAGDNDAAFPLLERAAALAPGIASIQGAYGRALALRASRGQADEDAIRARARTVLSRAMELEPGNISTVVTLAEIEMGDATNPPRAVALMERAAKAAPGREEYRLMLGEALAMDGDFAEASRMLGLLVERGSRPEVRDAARRMLARVAAAQNAARALTDATSATGSAGGSGSGGTADRRGNDPGASDEPRLPLEQDAFVPTLRALRAGEVRVVGQFSAVECGRGAIVLVVDGASGPVRLATKSFSDIEFLTYRDDSPSSIACGPQRPAFRVLATYRTDSPVDGTNTANRAVAIELLPDGFEVR